MSSVPPPPPRPTLRLGAGWWVCAGMIMAGLVWLAAADRVLAGGLLVAGGFVLAAVLRGLLPDERVGALHVRGRHTDVLLHAAVGLAVAAAVVLVHLREGA